MKPNYENLDDFSRELEHFGGWDSYRYRFLNCTPDNRAVELACFDKLLEGEHRVTREHAEFLTKRREIGDLHNMLLRVGR
jgi:hypothetical protein